MRAGDLVLRQPFVWELGVGSWNATSRSFETRQQTCKGSLTGDGDDLVAYPCTLQPGGAGDDVSHTCAAYSERGVPKYSEIYLLTGAFVVLRLIVKNVPWWPAGCLGAKRLSGGLGLASFCGLLLISVRVAS